MTMTRLTSLMVLCTVATLWLPRPSEGAPPVPTIDGPTERHPGALTFLDASGSCADKFTWLVDTSAVAVPPKGTVDVSATVDALRAMGFAVQEPDDKSEPLWAVSDDGKRLWLSSYPGVYSVTLGVSNSDGVALLPWKVKVSGSVPPPPVVIPPPVIVPPPVVVTDFPEKLTAAVKANPDASLTAVANTYTSVADGIKSGLFTTPDQVTRATSAFLAIVDSQVWATLDATIVQPHLRTLMLTKAADYEPVWRQIAAAVKAGLTDLPPPDVTPLPVSSLHVLIVEEMDERHKLPASQAKIFSSTTLRKWFSDNNVQWRVFDKDVPQEQLEQKWKDALARPRQSLPWILVSSGSKGYEGPLPKTEEEVKTLVEKYK